jgi:hypothetical protein
MPTARKDGMDAEAVGDYESRSAELGEYTASFETMPQGFAPPAELFKGLPDDACHSPHWGYLTKGVVRYIYTDGSVETVRAGDVYYIRPGHHFECIEDAEAVDFSPTAQLREVIDVVTRNMQTAE